MTPSPSTEETHGQRTVREYASYGSIVGVALGTIVGIIVSGPHFSEWAASTSIGLILACCAGGAFIGYLAPTIALGSPAGWSNGSSTTSGSSADGGCSGASGDSCGDSGGCGGDGGGGD